MLRFFKSERSEPKLSHAGCLYISNTKEWTETSNCKTSCQGIKYRGSRAELCHDSMCNIMNCIQDTRVHTSKGITVGTP